MNNLIQVLEERSKLSHTGITFVEKLDKEDYLSYEDLYRVAREKLASFQTAGLRAGDELIFQLDDNRTFVEAFWACMLGGIVPVPLTVGRTDDHKQKLVNVWGIINRPHLYTDEANFARIKDYVSASGKADLLQEMEQNTLLTGKLPEARGEALIHSPSSDDLAYIQFSSGSTGSPKGVMLTHRNLLCNVEAIAEAAHYTPDDSLVSWMPLTHDMGLIGLHLNPIFTGMPQCLIPTALFVRKPAVWMDAATRHKATILGSPNFGYKYLLKHTRLEDQNWELSRVRVIYNGAEPISESLCHEFMQELAPFGLKPEAMCPVYGLAEATLAVTISRMQDAVRSLAVRRDILNVGDAVVPADSATEDHISFVNVGTPIKYLSVRIGDSEGKEVPEGTIGHLLIKGGSVTSGYFNNPEATAAVMRPEGWLDTGDLGFVHKGCLYVTGRAKDIFFVNGQNYYPHDIERIAEEVEGVELNKIAIGGSYNKEIQKEEIIAFVFHRGRLANFLPLAEQVSIHINSRTGIELDRIIPVNDIPRTTSGKLQRFLLIQRFREGLFTNTEKELETLKTQALIQQTPAVAPATDTERMLLDMWKDTLNRKDIGVTHHFFTLGGNSLKAAEIGMKLLQETGVELSFATLYEKQTIRELAAIVEASHKKPAAHLPQAPVREWHPVAPAQRRLYYAWQTDNNSTAYNTPFAFELKGPINKEALEFAFREVISRHDSLRMVFSLREDEPAFHVKDNIAFSLSGGQVEESELQMALTQRVRPFDLANGPLIRAALLKVDENRHILFIDIHHIVSDGLSMHHLVKELMALHAGEDVQAVSASYADYAEWQHQMLTEDKWAEQEAFWAEHLAGELPVLELPLDFRRPAVFNSQGEKRTYALDKPAVDRLRALAAEQGCSMHALLFACYTLLLAKYAGQQDLMVGIPVAGRKHPDVLDMQGMFVNNLPVRTHVAPGESFLAYLGRVRTQLMQALAHQDIPFNLLIEKFSTKGDASRNPLFDTMFVYQNMGLPVVPGELTLDAYFFDPGVSKFDLSMEVFDHDGQLTYRLEYADSLFSTDTIDAFAAHFNELIRDILKEPAKALSAINLLTEEEHRRQLIQYNDTAADYPAGMPVHDLFARQAARTPDRVALADGQCEVTYHALNAESNRLANKLLSEGVKKGDVIGLWMPRSVEYVTAVWAVLKAGACFVPLDKDLPAERISYILNDARCRLLITSDDLRADAEAMGFHTLVPGKDTLGAAPDTPVNVQVSPADLAYIIYTSGTTGGPKGVMISHRSLVNYISWADTQYVKGEESTFPLYSSISFDLTITSLFTPLLTGNVLKIYEGTTGLAIEDVIRDNACEVLKLTPSHLKIVARLAEEEQVDISRIRRFIVGGEALETHLAARIYKLCKGKAEILNEYGPTEATVGCMIYAYRTDDIRAHVPIGVPAANTQIYVLDEYLNPVATGVKGEMYIAGDCLALGYIHNTGLTASKFVDNPFTEGARMYRTGDIARRLPDGHIEFIGRADEQVKVNGHRIEPAEIERVLREHEHLQEAVVILRNNDANQPMLVAYAEALGTESPSEADLRTYTAAKLPYYMVPSRFVLVSQWPLTTNGKVDQRALPAPPQIAEEADEELTEPARLLLDIWQDLFGRTDLTTRHNFFELGGDSIKAVQISGRYMEKGYAINVKEILTYQTVAHISRYAEPVGQGRQYEQGLIDGSVGSTPISEWFVSQQFARPGHFHQSVTLSLGMQADVSLIEEALNDLVLQHDGLRLNQDAESGQFFINNTHLQRRLVIPTQHLHSAAEVTAYKNSVLQKVDLSSSLLVSAHLLKQDGAVEDKLLVMAHHLVIDGLSWRVLLQDLQEAYQARAEGRVPSFPKTASLKDWSAALHEAELTDEEVAYWQATEGGETLPADREAHDYSVRHQQEVSVALSEADTTFLLQEAHSVYNTDVPDLLNTALMLTLKEWTGKSSFVIEHENHGRHIEGLDTSRSLGWFTAMYPVSLSLKGEGTGSHIKSIKEQLKQVPGHGLGYGIRKYLKEKATQRSMSSVRFNYLGQLDEQAGNSLFRYEPGALALDTSADNHMTTLLEWNSLVTGGRFMLSLLYNETVHTSETATALAEGFIRHLQEVLEHIRQEDDIHFTPSDFAAASLDEDDLDALFG